MFKNALASMRFTGLPRLDQGQDSRVVEVKFKIGLTYPGTSNFYDNESSYTIAHNVYYVK